MREEKEKFYSNQIAADRVSNLADKLSVYHSRLMALERDVERHLVGCSCEHSKTQKEEEGVRRGRETKEYIDKINKEKDMKEVEDVEVKPDEEGKRLPAP